jgi:DNA-binding SARP family transcriptional activator
MGHTKVHGQHEYCFQLLGPVRAWHHGRQVELGPLKQRALMALFLLNAGHTVRVAKVVETLWGDQQPQDAVNTVQVYVSRLRRAIRAEAPGAPEETLAKVASGYRFTTDSPCVDLHRFRSLLEQAQAQRRRGKLSDATGLLEEALELWQDDPLADLDDMVRERMNVESLERYRRQAVIELADAARDLGRPERSVPALEKQADLHPTDEQVHARLMLAYGAVGRRAAALNVFESIRAALADTLGLDPSDELKQAHTAVLRM